MFALHRAELVGGICDLVPVDQFAWSEQSHIALSKPARSPKRHRRVVAATALGSRADMGGLADPRDRVSKLSFE
jgi:hypothetical protein